jgi:hypothetical protein
MPSTVESADSEREAASATQYPENDAGPIVAHLVPDEVDVAACISEGVAERLHQELEVRLQEVRRSHVVAELVEVKTTNENSETTNIFGIQPSRTCWLIIAAFAIVLFATIIGVVVATLPDPNTEPLPSVPPTGDFILPTTPPTTAPPTIPIPPCCERFEELYSLIGADITSDLQVLEDTYTYQYQALAWLADHDPAELDFSAQPKQILIERYVLALLYFMTNGKAWKNQFNFLGNSSVCAWFEYSAEAEEEIGVRCDGDSVSLLELRKWKLFLIGVICIC